MLCLRLDFHPTRQGEDEVILGVDRQVVDQASPERLVEFRHHSGQILHRLYEPGRNHYIHYLYSLPFAFFE